MIPSGDKEYVLSDVPTYTLKRRKKEETNKEKEI
jgi:hypothetical protein